MIILLYLFILVKTILLPPSVQAEKIIFEDSFEQGLANWTVVRNAQWANPSQPCQNNGQPAAWHMLDGRAGMIISQGPSCVTELAAQDVELPDEFELEWDWFFKEGIKMDRNLAFVWQDTNNWYGLKAFEHKLLIQKKVANRNETPPENSVVFTFKPDQEYGFKLRYEESLIKVWIDDELVLETPDTIPFIAGQKTIALQASTGSSKRSVSYFDNIKLTDLNKDDRPTVNLIKQTDPLWAEQTYDRANEWAVEPTISRWGCALSSAVMILDYYGINQLPTGEELSPVTLNNWLLSQPDGYVGQGLVNWLAISRLSWEMSPVLETPVLEYNFLPDLEAVPEKLDLGQPVIVNPPGHFAVIDGYTEGDFYLKDPWFDYQFLSQHEFDNISGRHFTPSHTDLSYILIAHPAETTVSVKSGEVIAYQEYIQATGLVELLTNEPLIFQLIPKPQNNEYEIETEGKGEVHIWLYDQEGELTDLSQNIAENKKFVIDFKDRKIVEELERKDVVEKPVDDSVDLTSLISELYQQREIKVKYVEIMLLQVAQEMKVDPEKYQGLFTYKIYDYQDLIAKPAASRLLEMI